jgi:hypothetical protein
MVDIETLTPDKIRGAIKAGNTNPAIRDLLYRWLPAHMTRESQPYLWMSTTQADLDLLKANQAGLLAETDAVLQSVAEGRQYRLTNETSTRLAIDAIVGLAGIPIIFQTGGEDHVFARSIAPYREALAQVITGAILPDFDSERANRVMSGYWNLATGTKPVSLLSQALVDQNQLVQVWSTQDWTMQEQTVAPSFVTQQAGNTPFIAMANLYGDNIVTEK